MSCFFFVTLKQLLHLFYISDVLFDVSSFDKYVGLFNVSCTEILKLSLVQYMYSISKTLSSSSNHCVP